MWTKQGLKWLTCTRCDLELDFLVPIDTARDFNILKAIAVKEAHHDECPGIASPRYWRDAANRPW
jgi:hypothetical protein